MSPSFPRGWGKLDHVECRSPPLSIRLWWWSRNQHVGIKSEPKW